MNLPELVPKAIRWAVKQAQLGAKQGRPLAAPGLQLAHQVGVQHPELVRLLYVDQLPAPLDEWQLRQAVIDTGMFDPDMAGLTLGYTIFIAHGHDDARLVSHELRHVSQYETLGGIEPFIPIYLDQMVTLGYEHAPLEQDARNHEVRGPANAWTWPRA